jgi:hypothetical protein
MTDRSSAANSTFAIGGVSCYADSFVVAESSVLRMNICAENPAPLAVILEKQHDELQRQKIQTD